MKKLITITAILLSILPQIGLSQVTSMPINYQAVIRDDAGLILVNEEVKLKFTLVEGNTTGQIVYMEEHHDTTNQFGLVNIELGTGLVFSGDFYTIDWSTKSYFLKLELQTSNGQGFTDIGTSKFNSVPYANYALNAGNVNYNDTSASNEIQKIGLIGTLGHILFLTKSGGSVDLNPFLDNTDSQSLSVSGNQLSISSGNTVSLPTGNGNYSDTSATNELQAISFMNDTLTLSNGGKVYLGAYDNSQAILFNVSQMQFITNKQKTDSAMLFNLIQTNTGDLNNTNNQLLFITQKASSDSLLFQNKIDAHINLDADIDSTNELQQIAITGRDITITKGNTITIPTDQVDDADADSTNEIQSLTLVGNSLNISGSSSVDLTPFNQSASTGTNSSLINNLSAKQSSDSLLFANKLSTVNTDSQSLSISGANITISNGNTITLPADQIDDADADSTNELQVLSISNDTIFLSNGGFAKLPTDQVDDSDADSTNEIQTLSVINDSISISKGNKVAIEKLTKKNDFYLGQYHKGGIVFYVDSTGEHGLVCTPTDIMNQSNNQTDYYNAVSVCQNLKYNGYTDWYLPSKYQLNLIYTNLGNGGFGPYYSSAAALYFSYWSSTPNPSSVGASWVQDFKTGAQSPITNGVDLLIRAIRNF